MDFAHFAQVLKVLFFSSHIVVSKAFNVLDVLSVFDCIRRRKMAKSMPSSIMILSTQAIQTRNVVKLLRTFALKLKTGQNRKPTE